MVRKTLLVLIFISCVVAAYAQEKKSTSFPLLTGDERSKQQLLMDFTQMIETGLAYDYGASLAIQVGTDEAESLMQRYDIDNWKVKVQSSLEYPEVFAKSIVKVADVKGGIYQGKQVLGIRTFFPPYNYNMVVEIIPPYSPFNAILQEGTSRELAKKYKEKGYLDNIGEVYKATAEVYGLRQQEHLFIVTEDSDGNTYEYSFGPLNFIGWRELIWQNPSYLIKDTVSGSNLPIYPQYASDIVFKSIKIVHSSYHQNTDFVTYIKNVGLIADSSVEIEQDIDNEELWSIIEQNTFERRTTRIKALDMKLYFNFLEERKAWDYGINDDDSGNNGN